MPQSIDALFETICSWENLLINRNLSFPIGGIAPLHRRQELSYATLQNPIQQVFHCRQGTGYKIISAR